MRPAVMVGWERMPSAAAGLVWGKSRLMRATVVGWAEPGPAAKSGSLGNTQSRYVILVIFLLLPAENPKSNSLVLLEYVEWGSR